MTNIGTMLNERLEAGWKPNEIKTLMSQPLPPHVRHLAGLVAHRLAEAVDPALAPAALRARNQRQQVPSAETPRERDLAGEQWETIWHAEREALRKIPGLSAFDRIEQVTKNLNARGLDEATFRAAWDTASGAAKGTGPNAITRTVLTQLAAQNRVKGVA